MQFTVTQGLNKIGIGWRDDASYCRMAKPVTVVWGDNKGSVGKYVAMLPMDAAERAALADRIQSEVEAGFGGDLENLFRPLQPLTALFANGTYNLCFLNGSEERFKARYLHFEKPVNLGETDGIVQAFRKHVAENELQEQGLTEMDYQTTNLYEGGDTVLLATLPKGELSEERVRFFEERIRRGERPFAICLNGSMQSQWPEPETSETFVLDGHHKLQAYQNLGMPPAMALFTRVFETADEAEFDIETLADTLYPWQTRHLLDEWADPDWLAGFLSSPSSLLHKHIRQGEYTEYHPNGQLKSQSFYRDNRPDGTFREWYENGKRKAERHFRNGIHTGEWRTWHPSGGLESAYGYDENGRLHGESGSWLADGKRRFLQNYVHGAYADGYGFSRWLHTGLLDNEWWYRNGELIERKSYDTGGKLVTHEKYTETAKRLVPVPPPVPYFNFRDSEFMRDMRSIDGKEWRYWIAVVIVFTLLLAKLFSTH